MNIKEAIELVVLAKGRFLDAPDKYEALHIAKEALEKQIPLKPIKQATWKACPTCKQGIGVNDKTPNPKAKEYCYHCGQKLDWN